MGSWPGDADTLAWLNGAAWRYVYEADIAWEAVEALIAKGHAVRLGKGSARVAITMQGFRVLQQPSDGQEKKA